MGKMNGIGNSSPVSSTPLNHINRTNGRITKPRPSASYRETTRELLKTFPELPTGPSGRRRRDSPDTTARRRSEPGLDYHQFDMTEMEDADEELADDYDPEEDFEIFSGNSCGESVAEDNEKRVGPIENRSGKLTDLPLRIWSRILSYVHPVDLVQLRKCSRFFNTLLQQDVVWRVSRNNYMPELPKPVLGLSEVQMLQLLFRTQCTQCQNRKDVKTYWIFRTRCCKQCLLRNSTKVGFSGALGANKSKYLSEQEFALRSGSDPFPEELSDVMPFGMVDVRDNWISNPLGYQPNIGLTKIYWNADLEAMGNRYQEAKEMLAADEWLKGIESERDFLVQEIEKLEKFEKIREIEFTAGGLWRYLRASAAKNTVNMKDHDEPMQEEDGDGINADRRREIEDRCLKLNPRLSKKILVHLQSYQTAIKQYAPLDDEAWESLRASLLQERSAFEEQRSAEADGSGSNGNDQTNRAVQGWPLDDSPEGIQLSNRAKLADYAQAVIANWRGEITAETAPSFAATVLLNCRRQFFADESIRRGKLTLEDMKYIFDTKIRRLTQERRGELLFLCNGCPNNPRWWGFESLVQHFTAKHTFNPRGRPAKVNWMMDWPEIGPFRSDPDQAQLEHPVGMTEVIESPRPARAVIRSHAYSRQSPPLRGSQSFHHSAPASARHPYLGYERDLARRPQLEILAGEAEDAWYQLANIRGIPSSVHVHFVITRTARKYQTRFSETISLQLFLEALCETQAMAPIRAANGLGCLECLRHPGKSIDGVSKADRLFPITSLLQHFDTVHIKRNKSLVLPDWTRDMVRLPHPRVISDLAESEGVDAEKRRFLEDIFPWAFSKNGKHVGGVGKARSTTDSGRGSVVPSGPRHSGSTIASSQAELDASGRHGFPNISQDRLQQIQFAENHGKFNGTRASGGELIGYADISRNPQARIDSQRYPRRDSDHTRQPYDLTRMEPMVASSSRPVELGPISRGYVDPRDHQHHHVQDSAKQGGSHPTDNRRRSRPSAADFMESQARVPRPIEVNPYDDPRLRRYPDIGAQALPRRRSRSPPPIPREYRDPYATHSYESQARGRGIPPLPYPDPRLAYPPPPPPHLAYYGSAGMVDYHDPYRSRPPPLDHGYYAPPPPPPPHLMPPPVGGYYYEQINRPPSPTRYAHSHLAIPDRQPPPPMKDEYADYGRYKNR